MTKSVSELLDKALMQKMLSKQEGLYLYENAPTPELSFVANEIRKQKKPGKIVTWQVDRNVNITNVCVSSCKFCNFFCSPKSKKAYVITQQELISKITHLFELGGDQLLIQGGLNPELNIDFYEELFGSLKIIFPDLKLHALSPPEIVHLANLSGYSYSKVLKRLRKAGLDSLPGAGAEILVDRVRNFISNKCSATEWIQVMQEAHKQNILTSATMMFGHAETIEERIEHLCLIRQLQEQKPKIAVGFKAFIAWPFQGKGTVLEKRFGIKGDVTPEEYIRTVAISRIMLYNIENIQASWLTVGKETAQLSLHAGANDFGSIMIEEHVVSSAGANNSFDAKGIQHAIREAGFVPRKRNQAYEFVD